MGDDCIVRHDAVPGAPPSAPPRHLRMPQPADVHTHTDAASPNPADSAAVPSGCAGCASLDRRAFLSSASMLSIAAMLAACGDGVIDGPVAVLNALTTPTRVSLEAYPALRAVGGRAIVRVAGSAPVLVETTGVRQYRALSLVCPHKGTEVDPTDTGFLCPNHLARFDREGRWLGGQGTADLTAVGVSVVDTDTLLIGGPYVAPVLAVSTSTVTFTAVIGGSAPAAQTINLTNSGGGALSGLAVALTYAPNQPTGWLSASLGSLSAPTALTLSATRGTLTAGTYTATIQTSAAGLTTLPPAITVTLIVIDASAAPSLQLSTSVLALSTAIGTSPAAQTVQVLNAGGGTISGLSLSIAYGAGATGWLSTSALSGGTVPATLTIRPVTTGLAAGSYSATVTVSGTNVASKTLTVALTVTAAGLAVTLAQWPALGTVGGVAGSVGTLNFAAVAIVRTGTNSYAAFSLRCPHEGIQVQVVNGQSFRCPGHGATFNADGSLMANSPLRTGPLSALKVTYNPGDAVLYVS